MNKYLKYKPSGIEWIGEIPEHWEVEKMRYIGNFTSSGIDKRINEDEPLVKIINYTDIYGNSTRLLTSERNYMEVSCPEEKRVEHQVKKGDLVFTPSSETIEDIGLSALVDEDLENTAYSYHVLRFRFEKDIEHYFKKYLCNNHFGLNQFSANAKGTTRQILNRENFNSALVIIPPKPEQTAIANFLDEKTAQIDRLITNKQKLIELLKEERTVIINQAVLRGIKPNVKLKPSGIDWLGDIPEHWEVKKLKYIINKIIDNRGRTPVYGSVGAPMLEIKQIDGVSKYPTSNFEKFVDPNLVNEFVRVPLKKGDVLIATVGATAGKSAIVEKDPDYFIAQNLVGFRSNSSILPEFLFYVAQSIYFTEGLFTINKANTIDNLKVSIFINNPCMIPPVEEQNDILNYIETEIKRIDITISKIEKETKLLGEYRTALISEVVTGKIKVA